MNPEQAVGLALDLARQPDLEMPIAAVVLGPSGEVLGRGVNRREADHDPTAHAEILALREAGAGQPAIGRHSPGRTCDGLRFAWRSWDR